MFSPASPLATANEVGEVVGVCGPTIRAWARHGRIPSFRISAKTVRFDMAEVLSALRNDAPEGGQNEDRI